MKDKERYRHVFRVPLSTTTRRLHRECALKALNSNTLFVSANVFVRAKVAAILSYNFYRLFPGCSIVCLNVEADLPTFLNVFDDVGLPKRSVKNLFIAKRKDIERIFDGGGVFFATAKLFLAYISAGDASSTRDEFKLVIVNDAQKAVGHNVLAKVVRQLMNVQDSAFRVLGLSEFLDTKKVSHVQSMISNLCLSSVLVRQLDTLDVQAAMFPKNVNVLRLKIPSPTDHSSADPCGGEFSRHLASWKEGVKNFTEALHSMGLLAATEPDALIFSDFALWTEWLAEDESRDDFADAVEISRALVSAYRNLCLYGYRAFYLCVEALKSRSAPLADAIRQNAQLSAVYAFASENFAFPFVSPAAADADDFRARLRASHPKMAKLHELLREILDQKPDYKVMILCESCFGARAISEFCASLQRENFKFLENWSELGELLAGNKSLRGTAQSAQDKKWFCDKFRTSDISLLIGSSFMDNFESREFDCAIAMDFCATSYRFLKFGRQKHAILLEVFEDLPFDAFSYDPTTTHGRAQLHFNRSVFRMEHAKALLFPDDNVGAELSEAEAKNEAWRVVEYSARQESAVGGAESLAPSLDNKTRRPALPHQRAQSMQSRGEVSTSLLDASEAAEVRAVLGETAFNANMALSSALHGLRDHFIYDPNPVPELCDYAPLTSVDNFCAASKSAVVLGRERGCGLLQALCAKLGASSELNMRVAQSLSSSPTEWLDLRPPPPLAKGESVRGGDDVVEIKTDDESIIMMEDLTDTRKKFAKTEDAAAAATGLKITDHFRPIRAPCDADFSDVSSALSYNARLTALTDILSRLESMSSC